MGIRSANRTILGENAAALQNPDEARPRANGALEATVRVHRAGRDAVADLEGPEKLPKPLDLRCEGATSYGPAPPEPHTRTDPPLESAFPSFAARRRRSTLGALLVRSEVW